MAWLNNLDRVDACRDERHEVVESIAFAAEDDAKLASGEILLQLKILISRHEAVKPAASA